jgi:diacylglycerol kinase
MRDKLWSLGKSLQHACHGVYVAFRDERNMRIHGFATLVVVAVMFWLKVTPIEAVLLLFSVGLVWIAELFNTAIEEAFDLQIREEHPQVKIGKDVAAGAVLVASLLAVLNGSIILMPKLWAVFL